MGAFETPADFIAKYKAMQATVASLCTTVSRPGITGLALDEVTTSETTALGTYTNLATVGPGITVTRDGLYIVGIGAAAANNTSGQEAWMSYQRNATPAVDADCVRYSNTGTVNKTVAVARFMPRVLAAGDVLTAKYRVGGGLGAWEHRWILAVPID